MEWTPIEYPHGVRCALDQYPEHEIHRSATGQTFQPVTQVKVSNPADWLNNRT